MHDTQGVTLEIRSLVEPLIGKKITSVQEVPIDLNGSIENLEDIGLRWSAYSSPWMNPRDIPDRYIFDFKSLDIRAFRLTF